MSATKQEATSGERDPGSDHAPRDAAIALVQHSCLAGGHPLDRLLEADVDAVRTELQPARVERAAMPNAAAQGRGAIAVLVGSAAFGERAGCCVCAG